MTNNTDLANHALGLVGVAGITAITDQNSQAARTCLLFADQARQETLRMGRWNCATKRANLVEINTAPVAGYTHQFRLPTDFLRLLEVNGEAVKASDEYFEIEGTALLTDSETVWIRYIRDIGIGACDVLLQAAIAAKLAQKIAIPLTAKIDLSDGMENLFQRKLAEAASIDAKETASADNPNWEKVLDRSRLGRVRGHVRNPLRIEG